MNSKNLKISIAFVSVLLLSIGIYAALQTGESSPIFLAGEVELTPENQEKLMDEHQTLFIVLYDAQAKSPMPYGAMRARWDRSSNKMDFVLTQENLQVMFPEKKVPNLFRVKARIDVDGQAGMDQVGDLVGEVEAITIGSKDVKLVIDRKI